MYQQSHSSVPRMKSEKGSEKIFEEIIAENYWAYLTYIPCEILGWMTHKLDQDYWEKYQQPQICRWYHSNGKKQRGTKTPFDEG